MNSTLNPLHKCNELIEFVLWSYLNFGPLDLLLLEGIYTMAPLQIPKNLKFKPIFFISSLEMKVVHYLLANILLAHLGHINQYSFI